MKTFKLKMEDFISNELMNQITIVGGDGPTVTIGNGSGEQDPKNEPIGIGNPPPKPDPNKM